jgi:transposase InsO family protein
MASITQEMKYRESLVKYSLKYGVSKTVRKYHRTSSYIYFWRNRYDGQISSLVTESTRPKTQPNEHTHEELQLIKNLAKRNPNLGLMDLWYKLRARGYTRGITGLYKVLKRESVNLPLPQSKYIPKPYEQMTFPGERVQIDVKFVPTQCLIDAPKGLRLFQYTAIDEYSRMRCLEGFSEHNSYVSKIFLEHVIRYFHYLGFSIECVQVDNGAEFTKRFLTPSGENLSLFEYTALQHNLQFRHIKPHTPRHNGKVERSHREDQKLFYSHSSFFNLSDFKSQLKRHQYRTNNRPMRPLNFLSPREFLDRYLSTQSPICV